MSVSTQLTLVSAAKLIMACTMHSSASFPDSPLPGAKAKNKEKGLSIGLFLQVHFLSHSL